MVKMDDLNNLNADKIIDATGKFVLPTFCDSHTHIVFAGNRSKEFTDRINGLSYSEIAKRRWRYLKLYKTDRRNFRKRFIQPINE